MCGERYPRVAAVRSKADANRVALDATESLDRVALRITATKFGGEPTLRCLGLLDNEKDTTAPRLQIREGEGSSATPA